MHWAKTYLSKAGLLESTRRGYFKITPRGLQVVESKHGRIDVKFLSQFEEFQEFKERSRLAEGAAEDQNQAAHVLARETAAEPPNEIMLALGNNIGSLDRHKATKGLFVTTSIFSPSAIETAQYLSKRIVLIDGEQLAKLMIRHNVGCRVEDTLQIKKIDEDFSNRRLSLLIYRPLTHKVCRLSPKTRRFFPPFLFRARPSRKLPRANPG